MAEVHPVFVVLSAFSDAFERAKNSLDGAGSTHLGRDPVAQLAAIQAAATLLRREMKVIRRDSSSLLEKELAGRGLPESSPSGDTL